ncbi:unnamed protein product [Rotaria sp. Silwood2]|nr:unnamed protein product [Rotaria sp. Silwood2]CAF2929297.1 unnamed protein product [Rotaria sp. Silwood2]CAF3163581.1 unnamed protein product [Rotaria sp. Silwood2]CAF3905870.1 unnamed protein product [Rotaria sp. Silwood2]CAF4000218.1 unnamed protein product [Rotaria sp. Silwood2]
MIRTQTGDLVGLTSNGVDIYLGIRYGQVVSRWSPASLSRFRIGVVNATVFGPVCHQYGPHGQPEIDDESEDCLFLNIWVPSNSHSLLPVRVWIHGGGYTSGSGNFYDGTDLARLSHSIIVTINYRLGIFGFFPLPNVETRNIGWLDQQLALQWVQNNIASFGGNKTNVMIFGQSAGGGSIVAHLLMPSSWPLYSSIVLQSSGPYRLLECQQIEQKNRQMLENSFLECQSNITCFQDLSARQLSQKLKPHWIDLWPCVGTGSQLEEQPLTLIRKGEYNRNASVLVGFKTNEGQTSACPLICEHKIEIKNLLN